MEKEKTAISLITFGTVLATTISWSINQSILWAVVHGIFSWFYVIYYAILRSKGVM